MRVFNNLHDYLHADPASFTGNFPPFIDHMLAKIDTTIARGDRCLILTLTKKSSEEITNYMLSKGYKSFYLHSEVDTIDRREIIKKLKTGQIDVLVGVNLLREGIDLPEVGFIAILDADKEWFLRSTTALVQNIGRAARNPNSEVALYADYMTESMTKALRETYRRRNIQMDHNTKHGITPTVAISNSKDLEIVRSDAELVPQDFHLFTKGKVKKLKRMTKKEKEMIASDLKKQLDSAIAEWRFEDAVLIRDQLKELVGDEG